MKIINMKIEYAQEISNWKYDDLYSFYDHNENNISEYMDGSYYACIDSDDVLVGYFCFGENARIPTIENDVYDDDFLDIGLGMKPNLYGKGKGLLFFLTGINFAINHFNTNQFRLSVAVFNERAIKVYEKAGFIIDREVTNSYFNNKFLIMKYTYETDI